MELIQEITKEVKDGFKCKGVYTFTKAFLETDEQFNLARKIEELRDKGLDFVPLVRQLNELCQTEKWVKVNLVPLAGRANMLDHMANASPASSLLINYFAVGSNATAVADGNVDLGTEVYRNAIASRTSVNDAAYFTGFISASEWSGTVAEAGLFADGTAAANSGVLQSHVLVSTTKSITETLTIDWTYTLSNV